LKNKIKLSKGDLIKEQELSIAVMNLIAIEEHLAFTIAKLSKKEYVDVYNAVRKIRTKYMKEIVTNKQGETWCISKHLLATVMRLMESGIKYGSEGNNDKALDIFNDAIETYQLFWLIQKGL
jgi:hypothetical protein